MNPVNSNLIREEFEPKTFSEITWIDAEGLRSD